MPAVPPTRVLDGFGAFSPPPPTAKPIPSNYTGRANAEHPPGFYGPPEGLVAVNTLAPADRPAPLDVTPLNARIDVYRHGEPLDLRGPVFLAALALLLLDALVVIVLSGGIAAMRRRRAAAAARAARRRPDRHAAGRRARKRRRRRRTGRRLCPTSSATSRSRRRARRISPMSSPATPKSTTSAKPACRA